MNYVPEHAGIRVSETNQFWVSWFEKNGQQRGSSSTERMTNDYETIILREEILSLGAFLSSVVKTEKGYHNSQ